MMEDFDVLYHIRRDMLQCMKMQGDREDRFFSSHTKIHASRHNEMSQHFYIDKSDVIISSRIQSATIYKTNSFYRR